MRGIRRIVLSVFLVFILISSAFIFNKFQSVICDEELQKKVPIYSVQRDDKKVSLTFDVNWAEKDNLYDILDVLDKYNVKGTFFIMGGWVDYSEDNVCKLRAVSERGHEIGNHSYKHPLYTKIGQDQMILEAQKTDEVIEKYTGNKTKLFRFPSGDYNDLAVQVMIDKGYIPIQWSADSVDWKELGLDIEYKRVKKGMKSGAIILFHNNAKYTVENLDRLIKEYQNMGYEFVPVGDLIYHDNYFISDKGEQILK